MLNFTGSFMTALSGLYYSYALVLFYAVNNRVSLIMRRTRKSAFWQVLFTKFTSHSVVECRELSFTTARATRTT